MLIDHYRSWLILLVFVSSFMISSFLRCSLFCALFRGSSPRSTDTKDTVYVMVLCGVEMLFDRIPIVSYDLNQVLISVLRMGFYFFFFLGDPSLTTKYHGWLNPSEIADHLSHLFFHVILFSNIILKDVNVLLLLLLLYKEN